MLGNTEIVQGYLVSAFSKPTVSVGIINLGFQYFSTRDK